MFGIIKAIGAGIQVIRWVYREKKKMEADVDAYLTRENARLWRLRFEKIFRALESGNGNIRQLPKVIRWFFAATTMDNRVGQFGQWVLKSKKLEDRDGELDRPIYPAH